MARGERGLEWFFPSSRLLCAFSGNPLSSSLTHGVCFLAQQTQQFSRPVSDKNVP